MEPYLAALSATTWCTCTRSHVTSCPQAVSRASVCSVRFLVFAVSMNSIEAIVFLFYVVMPHGGLQNQVCKINRTCCIAASGLTSGKIDAPCRPQSTFCYRIFCHGCSFGPPHCCRRRRYLSYGCGSPFGAYGDADLAGDQRGHRHHRH